jgi:hypothetical protein
MENERSFSSILNMENKWRNAEEKIVLNTVIGNGGPRNWPRLGRILDDQNPKAT